MGITPKALYFTVLCAQIFLNLAYQKQPTKWQGTITEEDGVIVVKNPKEPMYGKNVISLEEELSIGGSGSNKQFRYPHFWFLEVDDKGRIYVLDTDEHLVKIFDCSGEFITKIGDGTQDKVGLESPRYIELTPNNEIVIVNDGDHSLKYLSLEGELIKSLSTIKFPSVMRVQIDSQDNIYAMVFNRDPENPLINLVKLDPNLNIATNIASCPFHSPKKAFNPFLPVFCWRIDRGNNIFYGYPDEYELKVFNSRGKLQKRIIKDYDPVEITEEEIDEVTGHSAPWVKLNIPVYHSAYFGFTLDEKDRIWIHTPEKTDDGKHSFYDVFDSEGKYIAKIPLKARPRVWKNNKLYAIEEDEEGYQILKRYNVNWSYR